MKQIFFCCIYCFISFFINGQNKDSLKLQKIRKNAFYLNAGFATLLNYERILYVKNGHQFTARLMYAHYRFKDGFDKNVPYHWVWNTGFGGSLIYSKHLAKQKHHLDIELMYIYAYGTTVGGTIFYSINGNIIDNTYTYPYNEKGFFYKIGWRRQRLDGGWLFRASVGIGNRHENYSQAFPNNGGYIAKTLMFPFPEICVGYSF